MLAKKTVIIVDDHPLLRQAISETLSAISWLEIIAECGEGYEAVEQVTLLQPDYLILDLALPGLDGFDVLKRVLKVNDKLKVVVLTSFDGADYMDKAITLGAKAYVIKSCADKDLRLCMAMVAKDELFVSASASSPCVKKPVRCDVDTLELLTNMEIKVLQGIAAFLTSKDIAIELDVSFRTIENHRANIRAKLNIDGSHQLTSFACKMYPSANE